jgi:hypothetical protein
MQTDPVPAVTEGKNANTVAPANSSHSIKVVRTWKNPVLTMENITVPSVAEAMAAMF